MKRQKKQLIALALVLLVLVLAVVGIQYYNRYQEEREAQEAEAGNVEVYTAETDRITDVSFVRNGAQTLALEKQDGTWKSASDPDMTLDQDSVSESLALLSQVKATRVLEDMTASDYGFDSPLAQITMTVDGEEVVFTVGMQNELTEEYYLMVNNDPSRIYVTDDTLYNLSGQTASDYEAKEEASSEDDSSEDVSSDEDGAE